MKTMSIQSSVASYLAGGGRIQRVPGFTGIKPLPVVRGTTGRMAAKPRPPEETFRAERICRQAGCSITKFRSLVAAGHLPKPDRINFNNRQVWSESLVPDMLLQIAVHTERLESEAWQTGVAEIIGTIKKK